MEASGFFKAHRLVPTPRGKGPLGGPLQSHHALQGEWAEQNLAGYGYDRSLAPTLTLETGKGRAHSIISRLQNARRDLRSATGQGRWSSTLQQELDYLVSDFRAAGLSDKTITEALSQQYRMLDKLGVPYPEGAGVPVKLAGLIQDFESLQKSSLPKRWTCR